ncbi:MAG: HAMP domain-containing histidine kinase [Verrucomicrobiae bacterium]|nr:HAMP domain-containing histidine kinase [Verrucomicrobiae bacterium]
MRLRFPLYAKILVWFFLNLAVLSAVFYGFFRFQFRVGLDLLLAGPAGDRVEAIGLAITSELREVSRDKWNEVLQRLSSTHKIQLYLLRPDGSQVAGEPIVLPAEVQQRLSQMAPPRPAPSRGGKRPRREELPPRFSEEEPRRPFRKFMVRTSAPLRYWVGIRLPVAERNRPGQPHLLLAASNTLSGNGLFLDFKPWVVVGVAAIVLSVGFWLPMIWSVTRSISQITRVTERIAEGQFDVRVNETRRDELGRLGAAINRMTGRLAGFVTGQRRFLGDVAHELCSPIARIQVALGILEQRADEKQRAALEDVREEIQQMSQLVNELLSFSKAGLRQKEIPLQPVALADMVRRVVAREAGERVQIEIAEDLTAAAEPGLLSRALANLVRNALRYGGDGPIVIRAAAQNGKVILTVTDSGPGVPEENLQQIFDPFFRVETSRSRETGGAGLGLAIVKACVEACRGSVTAKNCQPTGLQVEIRLNRHISDGPHTTA